MLWIAAVCIVFALVLIWKMSDGRNGPMDWFELYVALIVGVSWALLIGVVYVITHFVIKFW